MKRITSFEPIGDRYKFDFRLCTSAKGWAQLDSQQDASYFGNWVNPTTFEVVSYAEGDISHVQYEDPAEFAQGLLETLQWYEDRDGRKPGLDPGNTAVAEAFRDLGFGEWLH